MTPPRRPDWSTILTWTAIVLVVAALLSEGFGLVDAGRRLRAQEDADARAAAAADPARAGAPR